MERSTIIMQMRPYQQAAREAVHREWDEGRKRTLLVLPIVAKYLFQEI